jgi:hypothetical protein
MCRYCEDKKARQAAGNSAPGIVVLTALQPFKPVRMRCFSACCADCNSCHHNLCCACWRAGVRVDYKNRRYVVQAGPGK